MRVESVVDDTGFILSAQDWNEGAENSGDAGEVRFKASGNHKHLVANLTSEVTDKSPCGPVTNFFNPKRVKETDLH